MSIIKDETKRVIAHGYSAESLCDGKCDECTKDVRIYEGLMNTNSFMLLDYICPVGLAYGMRIESLYEKNLSEYRSNVVLPTVKNLIIDSLGNFNPEKIKKDIRISRDLLEREENIPSVKDDTMPVVFTEQPLVLRNSLSSSLMRKIPKDTTLSLF